MPVRSRPDPVPSKAAPLSGREILGRYSRLSIGTRFFLRLRWLWTPYLEMASLLPARGRILDGGCGHGLLSLALALQSPDRKILGLDHSSPRVDAARSAAQGLNHLAFETGDYGSPPPGPYEGVALIDCLHYLDFADQAKVVAKIYKILRRGGRFVFREVDQSPGFASLFNQCHESVMTGLGFTKAGGLHYRSGQDWGKLAEDAGFKVHSKPTARFPFADILFWCDKA